MKCPSCSEETIGFGEWCRALHAIRWVCPLCGCALRASRGTWISLAVVFALAAGVVAAAIFAHQQSFIPPRAGRTLLALSLPAVLTPLGWLLFRTACGYTVESRPDGSRDRERP